MGKLVVLIAAIAGGVTAAIVAIIVIACLRRRKRQSQPKFSRNPHPKRIVQPPAPKPDVRTAALTQREQQTGRATRYVEDDMKEHPPDPARQLKPRQPPATRTTASVQSRAGPLKPIVMQPNEFRSPGSSLPQDPPPFRAQTIFSSPVIPPKPQTAGHRRSLAGSPLTSPPSSLPGLDQQDGTDARVPSPMRRTSRFRDFIGVDGSGSEELHTLPSYHDTFTDVTSSPEDDPSNARLRGHLKFRLEYKHDNHALRFRPLQAKNVKTSALFAGTGEIFLKVVMVLTNELPADGKVNSSRFNHSWRSKPYRHKTNPTFDADDYHDFHCAFSRLAKTGVLVFVFDHDRYSRDSVIGHVWMPLGSMDVSGSRPMWRDIQKGARILENAADMNHGNIQFSLLYHAGLDHLTVLVRKATCLTVDSMTYTPTMDPYVSVALLRHGRRVARKDTPVCKSTTQPVFNAALRFEQVTSCGGGGVAAGAADECGLLVTVRDKTRLRSDTVIGAVLVGHMAYDEGGAQHWVDMLAGGGSAVERWHNLGPKPSKKTLKRPAAGPMLQLSSADNSPASSDVEQEPAADH